MDPLWNTDFPMLLIEPTIQECIDYDKYYQEFKDNEQKLDSIYIAKKCGIKLWLISREYNFWNTWMLLEYFVRGQSAYVPSGVLWRFVAYMALLVFYFSL